MHQILLISEIFTSEEILDLALEKVKTPFEKYITGSSLDAGLTLETKSYSIVLVDIYFLRSISSDWIRMTLSLYFNVSFILIGKNLEEEEIFRWLDLGFVDVVDNPVSLAISIRREIQIKKMQFEHDSIQKRYIQSSQFLRLLLDHVPAGIFWKDVDSIYMGCNQYHAKAMQFNFTDEIVGKSDRDFHYQKEKLDLFRKDDLEVIEENKSVFRITQSIRIGDNKEVWTETNKVPIHDSEGNVIGILGLYKDITKLILLEKEFREREEYYRTILENLSEGVIIYDTNLKIRFCNSSAEKITGYNFSDLDAGEHLRSKTILVNSAEEIIDKSQLPHVISFKKGEIVKDIEVGFIYSNKSKQWIRFNSVPVFENSKIKYIILTLEDITKKKYEQDRANQFQKDLENIFSNTHVCLAYLDTDFYFLAVNEAYAKSTGHSVEYFYGKNHFDLYPNTENEAIFRKVVETGEPFTVYAKPFIFPDHPEWGTTYWDWTLKPFKNKEGVTTHLLFSLVDVTENIKNQLKLKETELLYTNIFSAVSDSIVVLDINRNVLTCNSGGQKILTILKNYIKTTGKPPFVNENQKLIKQKDLPSIKTLKTGKPCIEVVIGIPLSIREFQWLLVNTQPIFSEVTHEVIQVVISAVDITEKKRIEKELFTKKKMEAIGNTASSIVHDFNNVLQPITLYSDLIKSKISNLKSIEELKKISEFTDKIQTATTRGKEMITQILKVAQKVSEPTQKVNLIKVFREYIAELQLTKPKQINIDFITELETASLEASETNIHQIISNLCNNAIYAMKNKEFGTLSIHLDKLTYSEELRYILDASNVQNVYRLIVRDEGTGIKPEDLEKIFEPFFSTKQNDGGTGLGLASVYGIVQSLKGNISVVSKENIGTRFTIHLPCRD